MLNMESIFDKIIEELCYILGFDPDSLNEEFPDDPYVKERYSNAD